MDGKLRTSGKTSTRTLWHSPLGSWSFDILPHILIGLVPLITLEDLERIRVEFKIFYFTASFTRRTYCLARF